MINKEINREEKEEGKLFIIMMMMHTDKDKYRHSN